MQSIDALSTRAALPRLRMELLERHPLQAQIGQALASRKLVLLIAPAGYGKTVALVQQLACLPSEVAVAWLSAMAGDGLHRLLTSLVNALDPFDLPWRMSPDALPEVAQREHGLAQAASEIAHALEKADASRGVIAIDDAHHVADPRVFDFFECLLKALPTNWTVAMTSRVDPPLPLARMLLSGELAEFRELELRFDSEEVLSLLRSRKPDATMQEAEQLQQSTEGWPVALSIGLMLSAQSASSMPQRGGHQRHGLFEYLAEEVLGQLPSQFQAFLLRCSILPRWTAERCAQVSGDTRAAHWLGELERRALFVTVLDDDELTLRLHDLFREFLQWKVAREHADELPELSRRAAQGELDPSTRIGYLLRAGDSEQALQDMMRVGTSMIHSGAAEQLLQLIDRFPPTESQTRPELAFLRGLCAWQRWAWDEMGHCMRRAMTGFERQEKAQLAIQARALTVVALYAGEPAEARRVWQAAPPVALDDTAAAACALAEFMLSTLFGPAASSGPHLQRLVDLVGGRPQSLHWLCFLYMHVYIGRWGLRAPVQALVNAVSAAADTAHPQMKPTALLWQSALALWHGDIEVARTLREQAAEEAHWLGEPRTVMLPIMIMTAMDRHVCGDDVGAQALLRKIADDAARTRRTQLVYLQMAGAFAAAASDWPAAQELLAVVERSTGPPWPYLEDCTAALRAELALHAGNASEARALLQPRLQTAADGDWFGTNHRVRVALARAELRLGNPAAAWVAMEPLLSELRDSGETLGLLLPGPAALTELAQDCWPSTADPALLALLREAGAEAVRLRAGHSAPFASAPSDKTLSDRELQVVALVAKGQSNKLIARTLGLSPHTVKRHMARVFDKTGHASRGHVAAWYMSERQAPSLRAG